MEYCDKGDLSGFLERMNINSFKDLKSNLMDIGEHKVWKFII